jgi:hypothetical protein
VVEQLTPVTACLLPVCKEAPWLGLVSCRGFDSCDDVTFLSLTGVPRKQGRWVCVVAIQTRAHSCAKSQGMVSTLSTAYCRQCTAACLSTDLLSRRDICFALSISPVAWGHTLCASTFCACGPATSTAHLFGEVMWSSSATKHVVFWSLCLPHPVRAEGFPTSSSSDLLGQHLWLRFSA